LIGWLAVFELLEQSESRQRSDEKNSGMLAIALAASACVAIATVPSNSARADTLPSLTYDIGLLGTSIFDASGPLLTIHSTYAFDSRVEHGALAALGDGGTVVWRSAFSSFTAGSNLSCGSGCLFVGSNNGLTFSFNALSLSSTSWFVDGVGNPWAIVGGTGIATLTGFASTEGTFGLVFSLLNRQPMPVGFYWVDPPPPTPFAAVATPIPAALPLFASGVFGLWMMSRRKRKSQTSSM
jgi:hypothetical protein